MRENPSVLVVDDEKIIRKYICNSLQDIGWMTFEASTARQAMGVVVNRRPDIIVLDLGLPDQDGMSLLKDLKMWSQTPILVVSGRGSEYDKISALEAGADDYVTKPFHIGELMARINNAHKRRLSYMSNLQSNKVQFGNVEIDFDSRRVIKDGVIIELTPTEYKLLSLFAKNAGKTLTHRQILNSVWGGKNAEDIQYLRIYMRRLRQKLESDPSRPTYFRTESAIGYSLETEFPMKN